jgi:NAD(P)-dependent dehydrogenase (short-subunit alcohol dehydrogenase family)
MVKRVVEKLGGVDILVNNAGASHAYGFLDADDDVWEEDLHLKVFGAIYFARAVIPYMKLAGGGAIVNVTTPGGKASPSGSLPTSASRAAGISITKALSKEFASEGIRVNTVCVGNIKSGQQRRRWEGRVEADPGLTLEQHYSEVGESIPLGRIGESREAGDVIAFLASDRASYVTGSSVNVDGGVSPVV